MEATLEAIKGGGGSIKVGTTGTISDLMSKELEPESKTDEASSRCAIKNHGHKKGAESVKRTKNHTGSQVPMLMANDNVLVNGTPVRRAKPTRKGAVEIVDVKCGGSDRKWVTDRLKKLNFSKLSESIV